METIDRRDVSITYGYNNSDLEINKVTAKGIVGNSVAGSNVISVTTGMPDSSWVGNSIAGTGIPTSTTITGYTSTTITISSNATLTNNGTVFTVGSGIAIATAYTQFGVAQEVEKENGTTIVEEDYEYHLSGKVSLHKQSSPDSAFPRSIGYTFDAAGNRASKIYTASDSATPYSKTVNVNPQYHPGGSDSDNFNRAAILTAVNNYLILAHERNYLGIVSVDKFRSWN